MEQGGARFSESELRSGRLWRSLCVGAERIRRNERRFIRRRAAGRHEAIHTRSPREFLTRYRKLKDEKWRDAEALFESALASQRENLAADAIQSGHARFAGRWGRVEEISQRWKSTAANAQAAGRAADAAVQAATGALASEEVCGGCLEGVQRGRGVRRNSRRRPSRFAARWKCMARCSRNGSGLRASFEVAH